MKAAPCSWRVRTKRISGVARSTSRIGRFIVPGMPNTCSIPSLRRQSTSACADVVMGPALGDLNQGLVARRAHDRLQHGNVVHFVSAGDRERPPFLRRARKVLELSAFGAYVFKVRSRRRMFDAEVGAIQE